MKNLSYNLLSYNLLNMSKIVLFIYFIFINSLLASPENPVTSIIDILITGGKIAQNDFNLLLMKLENITYFIQKLEYEVENGLNKEVDKIITELESIDDNIVEYVPTIGNKLENFENSMLQELEKIDLNAGARIQILEEHIVKELEHIVKELRKIVARADSLTELIENLVEKDNDKIMEKIDKYLTVFMDELDDSVFGTIDSLRNDIKVIAYGIAFILFATTLYIVGSIGVKIYKACRVDYYDLLEQEPQFSTNRTCCWNRDVDENIELENVV